VPGSNGLPESPVLFYVPLPLGALHRCQWGQRLPPSTQIVEQRCPPAVSNTLIGELLADMLDNPDWHRNGGTDHFLFVRNRLLNNILGNSAAGIAHGFKNMVSLTECFSGTVRGARYLAQIFPGPVRYDDTRSDQGGRRDLRQAQTSPKVLVSMVAGSRIVTDERFARIREVLASQCIINGHICEYLQLQHFNAESDSGDCNRTFSGRCTGPSVFSRLREGSWPRHTEVAVAIAEAYSSSTFCLQPGGDNPTRKGIFDSIAYDCIPVVFDRRSLGDFIQHVKNPDSFSVYIPKEFVMDGSLDVVRHLQAIPERRIQQLRSNLHAVQYALQYSIKPKLVTEAASGEKFVYSDHEGLLDAVDVTVDHLMRGGDTTMPWRTHGPWFDNFTEHRIAINEDNVEWASSKC